MQNSAQELWFLSAYVLRHTAHTRKHSGRRVAHRSLSAGYG